MTTLAPKLPYSHPFAGGYDRLGGQPLPTDPDAIDYLERVAAADGAAVEVGVAMAVDTLVKGCKSDGIWDAIKASCLLCGPRTLAGALVPLRVDYGPELVDIDNLPTPTITDSTGSSGAWDAASNTASNTAVATGNSYPRFLFYLGLTAGRQYRVTGRISSNNMYRVNGINLSSAATSESFVANGSSLIASGGTFDVLATASDGYLRITGDGRDLFDHTIEELSIREERSTPTAQGAWASGDYDRASGLKGNESTLYLDSNRANDADGQDDQHLAVYHASLATVTSCLIGSRVGGGLEVGSSQIVFAAGTPTYHSGRIHTASPIAVANASTGFVGSARSSSAENIFRQGGANYTQSETSETPNTENVHVFRRSGDGGNVPTDARLAFYSIGSSLDLAALDSRISTYVAAIAAAL